MCRVCIEFCWIGLFFFVYLCVFRFWWHFSCHKNFLCGYFSHSHHCPHIVGICCDHLDRKHASHGRDCAQSISIGSLCSRRLKIRLVDRHSSSSHRKIKDILQWLTNAILCARVYGFSAKCTEILITCGRTHSTV